MPEPRERRPYWYGSPTTIPWGDVEGKNAQLKRMLQILFAPAIEGYRGGVGGTGALQGTFRGLGQLTDAAGEALQPGYDFLFGKAPAQASQASPPGPSLEAFRSPAARLTSDPGAARPSRASFAGYNQPIDSGFAQKGAGYARPAQGMAQPPDPFAPPAPQSRVEQLMALMGLGPQGGGVPGAQGLPGASAGNLGPVPGPGQPSPPSPAMPGGLGGFFYGLGGGEQVDESLGAQNPGSVRAGGTLRDVLNIIRPYYQVPDSNVTVGWNTPETMGLQRQQQRDQMEALKLGGTLGLQGAQADYFSARAGREADPMRMMQEMYPHLARLMAEEEATERAFGQEEMRGERQRFSDLLGYQGGLEREQMQGEYGLEGRRISAGGSIQAALIAAQSRQDPYERAGVMLEVLGITPEIPTTDEQLYQLEQAVTMLEQSGDSATAQILRTRLAQPPQAPGLWESIFGGGE